MKFISAEEFLKQDKKAQRVFTDYFDHQEMLFEDGSIYFGTFNYLYTPLLTEGQLREFIEDKVESKISIIHEDNKFRIYTDSDLFGEYEKEYSGDYSILNALWNMAVETAKIVSREGEE